MNKIERLQQEVTAALEQAGVSKWIVWDQTQFFEVESRIYVELVLSDPNQISVVMQILVALAKADSGPDEFLVRAAWNLSYVGEPQLARTPDDRVVAASVIPVIVESDRVQQSVDVLVTMDAEMSLARILGHKPDLREVATVVIRNALNRGGSSSWDPRTRSRFEVTAQMTGDLSRQLARAA